jgi:hypothetical protein
LRGPNPRIEGDVVDLSGVGAIVKLESWAAFDQDGKMVLAIYAERLPSENPATSALKLSVRVKTKDALREQLAIVFVSEIDR